VTTSPPLARLLDRTADAVAAVRSGRSLTEALAEVDDELRPGVLALSSDVMRRLGTALAVRARLGPAPPRGGGGAAGGPPPRRRRASMRCC
jgi:16S rRNA (cytosine967-C5)-methyltransferase